MMLNIIIALFRVLKQMQLGSIMIQPNMAK